MRGEYERSVGEECICEECMRGEYARSVCEECMRGVYGDMDVARRCKWMAVR
jgi:hypothetical protein